MDFTRENLETLVQLQLDFDTRCDYICKKLVRYNEDFKYCYEFEIGDGYIFCRGYYTKWNESQEVDDEFPIEMLFMSDDELEVKIDELIEDARRTIEEHKRLIEEGKELQQRMEYERLKKIYETDV